MKKIVLILALALAGCAGNQLEECLNACAPDRPYCFELCRLACANDCVGDCPDYPFRACVDNCENDDPCELGCYHENSQCHIDCVNDCYESGGCLEMHRLCLDDCYGIAGCEDGCVEGLNECWQCPTPEIDPLCIEQKHETCTLECQQDCPPYDAGACPLSLYEQCSDACY